MTIYDRHVSKPLLDLFEQQEFPHQGRDPRQAKIVIVGLDANYAPAIAESEQFFQRILEYHQDGVAFWRKYGVHHPFLLQSYPLKKNTGGVPYHRKFRWLGLTAEYAEHVSFIELLPIPTTGQTNEKRFWELFDAEHAGRIDQLVVTGEPRMVVLSKTLSTYMLHASKTRKVFAWLPTRFHLGEMKRIGATIIYGAPHFSSMTYKKQAFVDLGLCLRAYCDAGLLPTDRRL
jgi:hypothetical protein